MDLETEVKVLREQRETDNKEITRLYTRLTQMSLWCGNVVAVFVEPDFFPELEDRKKAMDVLIQQLKEAAEEMEMGRAETLRPKYLFDRRPGEEKVEDAPPATVEGAQEVTVPRDDPITPDSMERELKLAKSWEKGKKPHSMSLGEEMSEIRKILAGVITILNGVSKLPSPSQIREEMKAGL